MFSPTNFCKKSVFEIAAKLVTWVLLGEHLKIFVLNSIKTNYKNCGLATIDNSVLQK